MSHKKVAIVPNEPKLTHVIPFPVRVQLEGSLMIAGGLHVLVGLTGVVGLLLRFIGPITVVPALTIMALYVFSATVRFAKAQWGITVMYVIFVCC